MPAPKKKAVSKVAPLPKGVKPEESSKKSKKGSEKLLAYKNLFAAKPRIHSIGQALHRKRDLTRFVKWPKYIKLQRQKVVLQKRLKIPPVVNQFSNTLDKSSAYSLLSLLNKHTPETPAQKKDRLLLEAKALAETGERPKTPKPIVLKYGINHITSLVEEKKAKLVVIAHDVDPLEIVLWLPALCVAMDVPYCIIKSKSRLGKLVHKKTASAVCLTDVKPECENEFTAIKNLMKSKYNEKYEVARRTWGGSLLGKKSTDALQKKKSRGIQVK